LASTRERFGEVLGDRPQAKVLIEKSTESEWMARCLEELGHELIVADPGFAPMYGTRTMRVKTDLRDAQALAEGCRNGVYRPAHRRPEQQRRVTTKRIEARRGKAVATAARARKLAGILFAMLHDKTLFDPVKQAGMAAVMAAQERRARVGGMGSWLRGFESW
jgi:transposase